MNLYAFEPSYKREKVTATKSRNGSMNVFEVKDVDSRTSSIELVLEYP